MEWHRDLYDKQREAASTNEDVVLLLAGPGTGKTLTIIRRISYLINEINVNPKDICVITFTRAAAAELKDRLKKELNHGDIPYISTLHSFAFTELLRSSRNLGTTPLSVRVADEWEESNIIYEDLKHILRLHKPKIEKLFKKMSSDWQTLDVDKDDWERRFPDPRFIGALRDHKSIYGYTVADELVYQLKHLLQSYPDILKGRFKYLLVDEYQDLNRCDLAIIKSLVDSGMSLFACGDDDQSIYSFRFAHPNGIRVFGNEYDDADIENLDICKRCDKEILDFGLFVARQDPARMKKDINSDSPLTADVRLLRFADQYEEAIGIAKICKYLIDEKSLEAKEIFILLKINKDKVFSTIIENSLYDQGIKSVLHGKKSNIFEKDKEARSLLAYLRLIVNIKDDLALRTIMKEKHRCGKGTIEYVHDICHEKNLRFSDAIEDIVQNQHEATRTRSIIKNAYSKIEKTVRELQDNYDEKGMLPKSLFEFILKTASKIGLSEKVITDITEYVKALIIELMKDKPDELLKIEDILKGNSGKTDEDEMFQDADAVNIMTMHGAKGLTAKAVIIVACEDEMIPGKNIGGDEEKEQLRLLYVSITRAKHFLYLTFCNQRKDDQACAGLVPHWGYRHISRFLEASPVEPVDGRWFTSEL